MSANALYSLTLVILSKAMQAGRGFTNKAFKAGGNAQDKLRVAAAQGYFTTASQATRSLIQGFSKWLMKGPLLSRFAKALGVQVAVDQVVTALIIIVSDMVAQVDQQSTAEIESMIERVIREDGSIDVGVLLTEMISKAKQITVVEAVLYVAVLIALLFKDGGKVAEKVMLNRAVGGKTIGTFKLGGRILFQLGWKGGKLVLKKADGAILFTVDQYKKNPVFFIMFAISSLAAAFWTYIEEMTDDSAIEGESTRVGSSLGTQALEAVSLGVQKPIQGIEPSKPLYSSVLARIRDNADTDGITEVHYD